MENILKNHPTRHFEEIRFWREWCQWYCTRWEKNKACGRVDKVCNNLWNCSEKYKDFYKSKKAIYNVTSKIDEANDAILDIY